MPWSILLSLLMFWIYLLSSNRVDGIKDTYYVYWNTSNPMFYTSSRANEIDINGGDSIDIVCPKYPNGTSIQDMEYYVVYKVSESEFNSCVIGNITKVLMIINCSEPISKRVHRYTLLIKEFQSIPGNPDFPPGSKHYFISTSGGGRHEVNNQYLGACHYQNMKIVLNVCCGNGTTTKPTTTSRTGTTIHPTTPKSGTTKRPTTPLTTTTTIVTTTTKAKTTTAWTQKPTDAKPGKGNPPDENVIHVDGPKNVGVIIDSAGYRTLLSVPMLLVCLCLAHLFR